ncbi:MAG TPA: hypothetical protein VJ813_05740 [Vicinamibacterales bacterium]|nr:hypothetical protein [Vicinamibacterales bacterium]
MTRPLVRFAGLIAAAIVGTWLVYGATLAYGFHYDDYHFVKPYPSAEVLATFSGPWDAAGIERRFYRPLTIAFYALRFELFGLNAQAHHTASLILFACASVLAGLLAGRIAGSWAAAALAAAVFVAHPAMAYAQAVWITNQMHLLASLIVLGALLWWSWIAGRGVAWWLPLLPLAAAAFLVKEDGIMLLPVVLLLHAFRRRLVDPDLAPAPRPFIALAALVLIGLVALRHVMLGGIGGYGLPSPAEAAVNFGKGLVRVFALMPSRAPWLPPPTWFAIALPLAALACWRRASPGVRFLFLAGGVIGVVFNLPFVLVTKKEQLHLVALGSSLLLAGSALTVIEAARSRAIRTAAIIPIAVGLTACAAIARQASMDFEPFGRMVLTADEIVRTWTAVPVEIRDYLERKAETDARDQVAPNPVDQLQWVAFGLHPVETSVDGIAYRRVSPEGADVLVREGIRTIVIRMRASDGVWQERSYDFRAADLPRMTRMHRVRIHGPGLQVGGITVQ